MHRQWWIPWLRIHDLLKCLEWYVRKYIVLSLSVSFQRAILVTIICIEVGRVQQIQEENQSSPLNITRRPTQNEEISLLISCLLRKDHLLTRLVSLYSSEPGLSSVLHSLSHWSHARSRCSQHVSKVYAHQLCQDPPVISWPWRVNQGCAASGHRNLCEWLASSARKLILEAALQLLWLKI